MEQVKDHVETFHWTDLQVPRIRFTCMAGCHNGRCAGASCFLKVLDARMLGDVYDDLFPYLRQYIRYEKLRAALKSVDRPFTATELYQIQITYATLEQLNTTYEIEDPFLDDDTLNLYDTDSAFVSDVEPFEIYNIERDGFQHRTPVFFRYFKRERTAHSCSICMADIHEVIHDPTSFLAIWETVGNAALAWKTRMFPALLSESCRHPIDFCRRCLSHHIEVALQENGRNTVGAIRCISLACERSLELKEVMCYAPQGCQDRYRDYFVLVPHADHPNFRWCSAAECSWGGIFPSRSTKIVCRKCGTNSCFVHNGPWHSERTCDQVNSERARRANPAAERASQQWVEQYTRTCPQCRAPTEKNGGCDHITCQRCGHEWCWLCKSLWADGDLWRHNQTCPMRRAAEARRGY